MLSDRKGGRGRNRARWSGSGKGFPIAGFLFQRIGSALRTPLCERARTSRIGNITGDRASSHAIATWAAVARWRAATAAMAPLTRAVSLPADGGGHGRKAIPSRSHFDNTGGRRRHAGFLLNGAC